MSATIDTLEGLKTAWAAASSLIAVIPVASLSVDDLKGGVALPYCKAKVEQEREPEFTAPRTTGQPYQDWQRLTLTVFQSTVAAADTALDLIVSAFASGATIPNATLLDWSLPETTSAQYSGDKDGSPVYEAGVSYVIWTQRVVP